MLLNERAVVMAVQRGDAAAFRSLVERYEKPIYGFLYRLVGDPELARDLAQDAFLAAYCALPGLKGDVAFSPWLYKIALNCARQALRRRRLIAWLPWTAQHDVSSAPLDLSIEAQVVHQALACLPADLRIPLVLRLVEGFSYGELAAIIGISEAAVRMRVLRARRMFRTIYTAVEAESMGDIIESLASGGEQ